MSQQSFFEDDKKRETKEEFHQRRIELARQELAKTNYVYTEHNKSYQFSFKEKHKPVVSFYPTTNKWVIQGGNKPKTIEGNIQQFIKWYSVVVTDSITDRFYNNWDDAVKDAKKYKRSIVTTKDGWYIK